MKRSLILILLSIIASAASLSADKKRGVVGVKGNRSVDNTEFGVSWAKHVHQGFNMRIWLSNQIAFGLEAWDPDFSSWSQVPPGHCSVGIGLEYPVGSCFEHMFGGGPWIGGLINGVRRVDESYNGDDARHEFEPERTDTARDRIWYTHAGTEDFFAKTQDLNGYNGYYFHHGIQVNRRRIDDDGDGKLDEDELDGQDNDGDWNPLIDDLGADGLPDSLEVSCHGQLYNASTNPDPAYDNFDRFAFDSCHTDANGSPVRKSDKTRYTQNNGIPDHGEPNVDEDFAGISERDYYMGATDTFKTYLIADHFPMGIKCFMKSYAWAEDFADGVLPFDYLFVNIGKNTIKQVYIAFHCDMDVGPVNVNTYPTHNYACYIPELRTAYVDNPVDVGSTPMGLTLLHTPRPLDSLKYIFQWHDVGEPGTVDSTIYNWISGGAFTQLIKPCQSPDSLTDTRFFFSFGPFDEMKPGDTLKFSVALVGGLAVEGGPHSLMVNAQNAIALYNSNYVLGVKNGSSDIPTDCNLFQNFPNPFNPTTSIPFSISKQTRVRIQIFNPLGQLVATLVDEEKHPGSYSVTWDAKERASGLYFYRMTAGDLVQTRGLLLIR
jgi:type IX secretion system substrate protein